MNFKNLILIGVLLLTILMVGVVSAADNVTYDNLTVSDEEIEIEEVSLEETPLEEDVVNDGVISNSDNFNGESNEVKITDFRVYTASSISIHNLYEDWSVLEVWNIPADGTLKVWVDGKLALNKKVIVKNDDMVVVEPTSIGIKTYGNYHVVAKYITSNKEFALANYYCEVYSEDADIWITGCMELIGDNDMYNVLGSVSPQTKYLDGKVTVYINGKQVYSKKFKSSQKIRTLSITNSDIGKGYTFNTYKVKIVYQTDSKTYSNEKKVEFAPYFYSPSQMSVGEKQNIIAKAKKGVTGTLKIYSIVDNEKFGPDESGIIYVKKDKIAEVKFVNGIASFPLDKLPKGTYRYIVEVRQARTSNLLYV